MFKATDYRILFTMDDLGYVSIREEIARVLCNCQKPGDRNPIGIKYHPDTKWAAPRETHVFPTPLPPESQAPSEMFEAIGRLVNRLIDERPPL